MAEDHEAYHQVLDPLSVDLEKQNGELHKLGEWEAIRRTVPEKKKATR